MLPTAAPAGDCRIATFYRFVPLPGHAALRAPLAACCRDHGVRGTIALTAEGVNGTIGGTAAGIDAVMARLREVPGLEDLAARLSPCGEAPFRRMKVRLREETVTLGVDGINPATAAGTPVPPSQWNELIRRDGMVVIDARNDYEIEIGSFAGARNPGTASFAELPAWIDSQDDLDPRPPVAMFCTGGIRCEKATAYLRQRGFEAVYQLDGGILAYLAEVPGAHSLWHGECFVFDERVSVGHGLAPGTHRLCPGCGRPVPISDEVTCERCRTP